MRGSVAKIRGAGVPFGLNREVLWKRKWTAWEQYCSHGINFRTFWASRGASNVSTFGLELVLVRDDLRLRVGWDRVRVFLSAAGWDGGSRGPFSSLGKADAFEKVSKHGFVHASNAVLGV